MSLYLCVFDQGGEVDGIDAGACADFNAFRRFVTEELEGGRAGSQFPTLVLHSDCNGEWPVEACARLGDELRAIEAAMREMPPTGFPSEWQLELARGLGRRPRSALECFLDADGEPLVGHLIRLSDTALALRQAILFQ